MHSGTRLVITVPMLLVGLLLLLTLSSTAQEADTQHSIHIWEVATGELVTIDTGLRVWDARLSADGLMATAALEGGLLHVYDVTSGEIIHERQLPDFDPDAVDVPYFVTLPEGDPDQMMVIGDGRYWLWDWTADEMLFEGQNLRLLYSQISPDGTRLLMYEGNTATMIALPSGDLLFTVENQVTVAMWSGDSQLIAIPFRQALNIYQGSTGDVLMEASLPNTGLKDVAWSPMSEHVAMTVNFTPDFETGAVFLYTRTDDTFVESFTYAFDAPTEQIAWNAAGTRFAIATEEMGGLYVFDVETGELVHRLAQENERTLRSYWSADGTVLAAAVVSSGEIELRMWDVQTGGEIAIETLVTTVRRLAQSPDRTWFAVYGDTATGRGIDLYNLNQPATILLTLTTPEPITGLLWNTASTHLIARTAQP